MGATHVLTRAWWLKRLKAQKIAVSKRVAFTSPARRSSPCIAQVRTQTWLAELVIEEDTWEEYMDKGGPRALRANRLRQELVLRGAHQASTTLALRPPFVGHAYPHFVS